MLASTKEPIMKPTNVEILDLLFRRPGLNKIVFSAEYGDYTRRGTVVYDTLNKKFLTHTGDIVLLAEICLSLRKPRKNFN